MRHGVSGRKLNRTTSHRLAMFRNMVTSLLNHERIYTTVPKAKEMRRWAEWMITLGKHGDLHSRRQALSIIREKSVVYKVFEELAKRYENRHGGYTRIVKLGFRRGDAAPMCLLELLAEDGEKARKVKKSRKKGETTPEKTEESSVS
ncbi:50S ribosomal subunit protein L17 [Syntrophobacter sp. SbD1]|nr:50S ribosomal subunit protein L17 [Syntrophobacter sp. SbD1]